MNEPKVITLHYNLFKDNAEGDQIESSKGKEPLVFLTGQGAMIPDFEQNVMNLSNGDAFSFSIIAENAYGISTTEAIIDLEKTIFEKEGKLMEEIVVNNIIRMQDPEGRMLPAKVLEVNDVTIKIDLNHPLADQNLFFTGEIVAVRAATNDEISHGHAHGIGGHQH